MSRLDETSLSIDFERPRVTTVNDCLDSGELPRGEESKERLGVIRRLIGKVQHFHSFNDSGGSGGVRRCARVQKPDAEQNGAAAGCRTP